MKKFFFLVCTVIFFVGCSNEDNITIRTKSNGALDVLASISDKESTKSLKAGTAFIATDQIKIALKNEGTYSAQMGVYQMSNLNKWEPLTLKDKVILLDDNATVSAIYPSTTQPNIAGGVPTEGALPAFDSWVVTLPANEESFDSKNQTDYMIASGVGTANGGTLNNLNPQASFNFEHIFSRISLVVKKGPSYSGTGKLTEFRLLKDNGFNAGTGKLDIWSTKQIIWDNPPVSELSFTSTIGVDLNDASATTPVVTAYGMIVPIADASGITLKIKVGTKVMSASLPSPNIENSFKAGKNYIYTITVDGTRLSVSEDVSTTDWEVSLTGDFDVK